MAQTRPPGTYRFAISATLKVPHRMLKQHILSITGSELVAYGTAIKCRIAGQASIVVIECGADLIVYDCTYLKHTQQHLVLLNFISLLAVLSDCYDVQLKQLYRHIVSTLVDFMPANQHAQNSEYPRLAQRIDALSRVNAVLAQKLVTLNAEINQYKSSAELYKQAGAHMASTLSMIYSTYTPKEMLEKIGLPDEQQKIVLQLIEGAKY